MLILVDTLRAGTIGGIGAENEGGRIESLVEENGYTSEFVVEEATERYAGCGCRVRAKRLSGL